MFQFYFKEKFDVLSSRYRHVKKMHIHLVFFALFIYTIIHQSFVSTAPTYGDSRGIVLDKYFLIVPAVPWKCGGYNIGILTLLGFSVV